MDKTKYSRKLDTQGRIMLPIRLREELNFISGEVYDFFIHEEKGHKYLCIECPNIPDEKLKKAMKIVQENGMKIVQGTD